MSPNELLKQVAFDHGWDYLGVADIRQCHDYLSTFCGDLIRGYPRAISLVIRLSDAVVDSVETQESDRILSFHNYIYYAVDYLQNTGGVRIARLLEKNGWRAYLVPASYGLYQSGQAGLVSHKLVARLAGLGWIGKSGLFLTPADGPRVRLMTILTDAPLEATAEPKRSRCQNCIVCAEACPAKAISGTAFDELEPDRTLVDRNKCKQFMEERKKLWGITIERSVCGLCVAVCPYGKRPGTKSESVSQFEAQWGF